MPTTTDVTAPAPLTTLEGRPAASLWALHPDLRHLNHGSFGAVPRAALAHQAELRQQMELAPVAWFPGLPQRIARARRLLAPQLHVEPERLALLRHGSCGRHSCYDQGIPLIEQVSQWPAKT